MDHMPPLISKNNIKKFLGIFDNILVDCDGVLWTLRNATPGAAKALDKLRALGKKVFYITNNPFSREALVVKCRTLGYVTNKDEVITTSYLAAQYLKSLNFKKKVFALASRSTCEELKDAQISYVGDGALPPVDDLCDLIADAKKEPDVGAVLVGIDEYYNMPKISLACSYLLDPECLFIVTSTEGVFLADREKRLLTPGPGALVSVLEATTGRKADALGKPSRRIFDVLQKHEKLNPERTLMIGDNAEVDIAFGKNCGLHTTLALTGVTTFEMMEKWCTSSNEEDRRLLPDYYIKSIGDLAELL